MSFESELTQFSKLIRKRLSDTKQAQIRWVKASKIDADNYTMVGIGLVDELEYYDVMLGTKNMATIPVDGSPCLIGVVEGEDAHTFLIHAEQPDQIIINANTIFNINTPKGGSLGAQLSSLIDEICKIYVIQGTSPNVANLKDIQKNIVNILEK